MQCPNCSAELCHGGDHDLEDVDETHGIVSNLHCLREDCDTEVLVYSRFPPEDEDAGGDS